MMAGKTSEDQREVDRLRVQLERTQLQIEVSNVVVSKLTLKDLLVAVSDLLKRFINHDFASVVLYSEERQELRVHALDRPPPGLALDAGLVIPSDFAKRRMNGETAEIQILVDGVNSNTAAIAGGYATRIVSALNQKITVVQGINGKPAQSEGRGVLSRVLLLYNPGLKNSWFIVTGMIGMLLVMLGIAVSSSAMVKEKEIGTIEQLLMTPADGAEIIVAKIAPIFLLLSLDIGLAVAVGHLVFDLPVRGSLLLLYGSGMLCVLSGIGIGTIIATFTRSQQQAQLLGFFVTPPLSMLSGATTPIEAIPDWLQPITYLNPVRHFASLARGVMLKGVGIEVVYPNLLTLLLFTIVLMGVSTWRFRKQLN